jgi:uncharacterized membrane protein YkvA (DUF1232 family)
MSSGLSRLRLKARALKRETYALYPACRDPRTPWYAKLFVGAIVAYALSPLDLIPDFIPVLGYVDDLVLVPLGILVAMKMIPSAVLAECRARAQALSDRPTSRSAGAVIVAIWIAAAAVTAWIVLDLLM